MDWQSFYRLQTTDYQLRRMSYLVLARKWRPAQFAEVVGQEHVVRALVNALQNKRLHHALLFTGTRGVGKTTIARIYAKALNCEAGVSAEPCDRCTACEEINTGRFVDLIEVDAASRTRVDETRELMDNVQYAPARGRYKVYLIDEVHMLSIHSFNALLKTLEEPPPHVQFLLATTDPQKLPVTVLSRCLQFNLKRLPADLIEERLATIVREEGVEHEPGALKLLARSADGSMRDALSLLDQLIAYGGQSLKESAAREMLGTVDLDFVVRLLDALAAGDGATLLDQVAEMDQHVPDYASVLREIARVLQRLAITQSIRSTTGEEAEDIVALADRFTAEDLQLYYQIAVTGGRDLSLAPDPRSGFEMILLRMLAFMPGKSTSPTSQTEPKSARKAPARRVEAGSAPGRSKAMVTTESDWTAVVTGLAIQGLARQLAEHSVFAGQAGSVVRLQLDQTYQHLLRKKSVAQLEQALSEARSESLSLEIEICEPTGDTPASRQVRKEQEKMTLARESIDQDPGVSALKEMFDASVEPDSIRPVDRGGSR